jgi:segregation and condensation protein A
MGVESVVESALTNACRLKLQNFEGPFDLLFHLIEKNQVSIYDIPINEITDQYMEYLFAMQKLDLEVASEFLVMASTLLHIKSRLLLPEKKEKLEEEDPREELILRLVEYKKYKDFSHILKRREQDWMKLYYKLPEVIELKRPDEVLELCPSELRRVYVDLVKKNKSKLIDQSQKMAAIIQHERVSLKSKMKEVVRGLLNKTCLVFSQIFSLGSKSKIEVVTGFLAILELSKLKKVSLKQDKQFSDIIIYKLDDNLNEFDYNDFDDAI